MTRVASTPVQPRYDWRMEYARSLFLFIRVAIGYALCSTADYKDDMCDQPRMRLPLHWRRW